MSLAISISNVTFRYESPTVLDNISFSIRGGEVVGLLGPNGSGKSTLVKLLCGLMRPESGTIRVLASDPYKVSTVRRKIGVVHQEGGSEPMLSGWQNLFITGRFFGLTKHQVRTRVEELTQTLGPFDYFDRPVLSTSGGQIRRLQVVRALLHRPRLLLLDEPTVALDTQARFRFYTALRDLNSDTGVSIVWTSHHLDEIERNCDRAVMLSRGVVVTDSPIHDLRKARASFQTQLIVGPTELTRDQLGKLKEFRLNQVSATEFAYQGEPDDFLYASALPFLVKANAIPVAIRRPEPSLEDIYMELTSEVV